MGRTVEVPYFDVQGEAGLGRHRHDARRTTRAAAAPLSDADLLARNSSLGTVPSRIRAELRLDPAHEVHVDLALVLRFHLAAVLALEAVLDELVGGAADVHFTGLTAAFHAAGGVHGIAPDVVGELALAHHACHHRTGVHADAQDPRLLALAPRAPLRQSSIRSRTSNRGQHGLVGMERVAGAERRRRTCSCRRWS